MSGQRPTGLATAFDEMLERNRQELKKLFDARPSPAPRRGGQRHQPQFPAGARTAARPRAEAAAGGRAGGLHSGSDAARRLDRRYGDGWRFEVVERRREGDEAVVVGKLHVRERNLAQFQTGRARVHHHGEAGEARGTVDGVPFAARLDDPDQTPVGANAEEAAFRRATEEAAARFTRQP